MKNVWKSIGAMLLLFVLVSVAGFAYAERTAGQDLQAEEQAGSGQASVKEWAAPDVESLSYYGLDPFETELPVLYIDTHEHRITKENKTWATLSVLDAAPAGETRSVMETPDHQEAVTIKYRGASSYAGFDKKQYRIKFYKKEGSGNAKDVAFLGMGRNSEWVLNGPFLDRTLIRNRLVYGIGREMFEWAPDSRYAEVFVDGEYEGVYLVVEPVTNGESRLRLSEFGLLSGETSYIVKRDRSGTEDDPLPVYGKTHGKTNNDLYIAYPSSKKLTDNQRKWIIADISAFEKALFEENFDDPVLGYSRYIDLDCFADYFILNEAVMNNDAGNLSTYPYKELGGKLKIAIWDYNNCYDNYQWFEEDFSGIFLSKDGWFGRLLQDRAFVDRVVERYRMWRESALSTDSMFMRIEEYQKELGEAKERNFAVWGYVFDISLMGDPERDITSYEDAVRQLRSAIRKRFAFLDEHITDLYAYCIN